MANEQPTVFLLSGLPGAGKTRLAKQLANEHRAVRFSLHEWIVELTGRRALTAEDWPLVRRFEARIWKTAVRLLSLGNNVVLDWNMGTPEDRQKWISRITAVEADHQLHFINVPTVVCEQRVLERNQQLPAGDLFISVEQFQQIASQFVPPTVDEALNLVESYYQAEQPIHNPHLNGRSFHFDGGPVGVLLIHGLTATTTEVSLLAKNLHDSGYTISAPLLPGHGTKPEDLYDITWNDWAWEVEMQYQRLATLCDHVFVGGESTGAVLALELALRHPEIAGLLCYAPAIKLPVPTSQELQMRAISPIINELPKNSMGTNPYWQGYRVYPLRAALELIRLGRYVRRRLEEIHQPTLVVQGRNDKTISPDSGEIILNGVAAQLKEMHWMESSGHIILLEKELPQITAVTLDFMGQALDASG